jgi:hypothetical protein
LARRHRHFAKRGLPSSARLAPRRSIFEVVHAAFPHDGGDVFNHCLIIVARAEPAPLGHIESLQICSLYVPYPD